MRTILAALAVAITASSGALAAGVTERASVSSAGVPANADSEQPSLSGDGRFVVFDSGATNLVPGDRNRSFDVFVHDRATGSTRLVSLASGGAQGNAGSGAHVSGPGVISRDGRHVAFYSSATNLVPGDTNGKADVFVRDLRAGTTVRASVGPRGRQADGDSFTGSISATGRFVLFTSRARNLVPYDGARRYNLFVHDLATGATTLEGGPDLTSGAAAITPDGRFLAFASAAADVVPGHPAGRFDVFLRDRRSGATTLVSVARGGGPGNDQSSNPFVSDDGTVVAFTSLATDLVPGTTPRDYGVFVRDLRARTTTRVLAPDGEPPDGPTLIEGMSADGRWLLLESFATNLVPGDTNGAPDLFLYDRRTRATTRANVSGAGRQADGQTYSGTLSADGRVVAFPTDSTNLVPGSVDGRTDVYVRALTSTAHLASGPRR